MPEDLDTPSTRKASGVIELPFHVRWSEPFVTYDLGRREDRIRVYEQVLREGTEDDVRYYIDPDELQVLFEDLVLPSHVRRAWSDWIARHGGTKTAC